jgi:glycosyltransferase involved in cell wall biosynthesis
VLDAKAELDKGILPAGFSRLVKEIKTKLLPIIKSSDWLIAHNVCSLHKNLALTAAIHELSQENGSPKIMLWHHDLAWTSANYRTEMHSGYPWNLLRTPWPGITQVTISEQRRLELAELQQMPVQDIHIVPNGLDIPEIFKLGTIARKLVKDLDLMSSAPIFLLPVRITRRKNIELAMRIMAALRGDLPTAKLVITGPVGAHNPTNLEYFEELKRIRNHLNLEKTVCFLAETVENLIPDEAIFDLYRVADALLLPSFEEGFGIWFGCRFFAQKFQP